MKYKTQPHELQKPLRDLRVLRGEKNNKILEQLQKVRPNTWKNGPKAARKLHK